MTISINITDANFSKFVAFRGILDDFPTTGVAVSLNRLSSSYAGTPIRVRRSTDSAEMDIPFNLSQLDVVALLGFVKALDPLASGYVTKWYDQSGLRNLVQATPAKQALIVNQGVLVEDGGLPALLFSGAQSYRFEDSAYAITNDISVINVMNYDNSGSGATFQYYSGGMLWNPASGVFTAQGASDTFAPPSIADRRLYSYYQDGATLSGKSYENGIAQAVGVLGITSQNIYISDLGAVTGGLLTAKMQAAIIYMSDVSTNREEIEARMMSVFGI